MAIIKWNDSMSVGVGTIDKQHMKLVQLINDFYENQCNNDPKNQINKLLDGLVDYTVEHFKTEEKLMIQYNYPEYLSHKKEHDLFVEKVSEIVGKLKSGRMVISLEITTFVKQWVVNHINGTDQKYSSFFVSKGVK